MFGLYERPVFYRRSPSLIDQMFQMERQLRAQRTLESLLYPELFAPQLYYIIRTKKQENANEEKKEEASQIPKNNDESEKTETQKIPEKATEVKTEKSTEDKPIEQTPTEETKPAEEKHE